MSTVITVENLSKKYTIGHQKQGEYKTFRDTLSNGVKHLYQRFHHPISPSPEKIETEEFWALKDINFEVKQGDRVGIIGRNGAGKSTLLKILSRITQPTTGRILIKGRIASLLEVGTGFHPELTGRENIYLNGAILGMTKNDIKMRFDEIVTFAEIEKFLDTPVKRYSSGMYVRLAFAVAAHLEPEILLVDEVLAVGDTQFQKKCLGKMEQIGGEGRTVLFVSHNMATVQFLCSCGILLKGGQVGYGGTVKETINSYLSAIEEKTIQRSIGLRKDRKGGEVFRFQKVDFIDSETGIKKYIIHSGQNISVKIKYSCHADKPLHDIVVSIGLYTLSGTFLFSCRSDATGNLFSIFPGEGCLTCQIPKWPLNTGRYFFNLMAVVQNTTLDWIKEAGFINVEAGDYYGSGKLPAHSYQGVFIDFHWEE